MDYKTSVRVKHQFKGMHAWALCPIEDVEFLRNQHRHVFYVEVNVVVDHPDRAIEFFMLQRMIDTAFYNLYKEENDLGYFLLGSRSCEMIAKELIDFLVNAYDLPSNEVSCSVYEDNENGATVKWCRK